ncbi:filamin-B [Eurytemora carolleeae]|uniref:filamin-B n=1 Tax=Eurytemora carolleeae TaxID=1294199 RepID=UPI000C76F0A4|nr:filamin-B [Eurytemora carolleeae]|eukprot:XP_023341008.1 filamin-B-like [Eurytemora affinis]
MTMETIQHTLFKQETVYKESNSESRNNSRNIPIQFSGEASACVAHGEGLDRPRVGRQNSFLVDCSAGGSNVLFVGVYGPDTPCEEVHVRHEGNKEYRVTYSLREEGQYLLFVKWGEEHIPGSPFHISV